MKEPIHRDVIECFQSLDIDEVCKKWLDYFNEFHNASILHFESNGAIKKNKENNVGSYSKLFQLTNGGGSTQIKGRIDLLEPEIANKKNEHYKISSSNGNRKVPLARSLTHSSESLDIQNAQQIYQEIWKGKYGPKKALLIGTMKIKYSKEEEEEAYFTFGFNQFGQIEINHLLYRDSHFTNSTLESIMPDMIPNWIHSKLGKAIHNGFNQFLVLGIIPNGVSLI
ncbi:hypothetical protein ACTA71_010017 [Dictyostelium dimigraforme]